MVKKSFGVSLYPSEPVGEMIKLARLADELGYERLWVGDSHLIWRNVYVNLAAFAFNTSKIKLGTGVTNPLTRHPTVTANAIVTLNELALGRVILGIGTGDSALATMGRKMAKMAFLEDSVFRLRKLLRGEVANFDGKDCQLRIVEGETVPIYISAIGPKMLYLAGKIADGVIMTVGADDDFIRAGLDMIKRGAEEGGRDINELDVICWVHCSISDDGEKARENAKVAIARLIRATLPLGLSDEDKLVSQKIERAYNYTHHLKVGADHSTLVPNRLVDKFAVAGTPPECRKKVERLSKIPGINGVDIDPYGDREFIIRSFAQNIMT